MPSIPSQSICALETGSNRKFLFFVDKKSNIAYYEREAGVAANYDQPSHGVIKESKSTTPITVASRFISGITYNGGTEVGHVPFTPAAFFCSLPSLLSYRFANYFI